MPNEDTFHRVFTESLHMSISAIFSFIKSDKLQLTMSESLRRKMLKLTELKCKIETTFKN